MGFKNADDRRAYARAYYHNVEKNDPAKFARRMRANDDTRARLLVWFRDIKRASSCLRCGEFDPVVLDFHHRDGSTKVREVTTLVKQGASRARILEEIAKCDVLCANCHRREHFADLYE